MILMLIKYLSIKKKHMANLTHLYTGYNDNDVIRPLFLGLPQMTGYINKFDENNNKNITMLLIVKNKNK